MTFEALDDHGHAERFAGIHLAWEALRGPQGTTVVLNAANEIAVDAFLNKRIRFDQIHHVNLGTLSRLTPHAPAHLSDLLALDHESRRVADQVIAQL
jgi:1-deoxy-D-xylulose-5-phosphate reductoisomerase